MDCAVAIKDGRPVATKARRVRKGDDIVVGREESLQNACLRSGRLS
jgi:hypothetical protein